MPEHIKKALPWTRTRVLRIMLNWISPQFPINYCLISCDKAAPHQLSFVWKFMHCRDIPVTLLVTCHASRVTSCESRLTLWRAALKRDTVTSLLYFHVRSSQNINKILVFNECLYCRLTVTSTKKCSTKYFYFLFYFKFYSSRAGWLVQYPICHIIWNILRHNNKFIYIYNYAVSIAVCFFQ